jgi:hypothetical protein
MPDRHERGLVRRPRRHRRWHVVRGVLALCAPPGIDTRQRHADGLAGLGLEHPVLAGALHIRQHALAQRLRVLATAARVERSDFRADLLRFFLSVISRAHHARARSSGRVTARPYTRAVRACSFCGAGEDSRRFLVGAGSSDARLCDQCLCEYANQAAFVQGLEPPRGVARLGVEAPKHWPLERQLRRINWLQRTGQLSITKRIANAIAQRIGRYERKQERKGSP